MSEVGKLNGAFSHELERAINAACVKVMRRAAEEGRLPDDYKGCVVIASISNVAGIVACCHDHGEAIYLQEFYERHALAMFGDFLGEKREAMRRGGNQWLSMPPG